MTFDQWKASTDAKVAGSWNLHTALGKDLDFFVLFSSLTSVSGSRGQANYVAGNSFLDSLARHRRRIGQKAICLNLGAMVSDGMLAENTALQNRVLASGHLTPIDQAMFFSLFDHCLHWDQTTDLSASESQMVFGFETPANIQAKGLEEEDWLHDPLFRHLWRLEASSNNNLNSSSDASSGNKSTTKDRKDYKKLFMAASSSAEASDIVTQAIVAKLAHSLEEVGKSDLDWAKPMHSYGVDSLLGIDLRSWIMRMFQVDVPVFEILGGMSFASAGSTVVSRSGRWAAE